jgi:methylmalonyl-CoA epimerase
MILKMAHIGIVVSDIEKVRNLYVDTLGLTVSDADENDELKWIFMDIGETSLEFLESKTDSSPIANFLSRKGEGVHHIALETDDIEKELQGLKTRGTALIDATPRPGAHNSRIAFLHPRSSNGVLIELVQPDSAQ